MDFGFVPQLAWEFGKCCYDYSNSVMHMWNFKCSHERSKGKMSGAVVGDDDDNHKQTATSRHLKTRKTFINHKHLLNRSLLLLFLRFWMTRHDYSTRLQSQSMAIV
jgi:hypothetical protein